MWRIMLFLPTLLATSSISLPDLFKYTYSSIYDTYSEQSLLLTEYALLRESPWKLFNYQLFQTSCTMKKDILDGFLRIFRKNYSFTFSKYHSGDGGVKGDISIELVKTIIERLQINGHSLSLILLFEAFLRFANWPSIIGDKTFSSSYAEEWAFAAAGQGNISCLKMFDSNLLPILCNLIDAACAGGSYSTVIYLIKTANIHGNRNDGRTAFHNALRKAVKHDKAKLLADLIRSNIFPFDIPHCLINSLVRTAIIRGRLKALECLTKLFGRYSKVMQNPAIGYLLIESAGNGNIEVINYLFCGGDSCLPDLPYLNSISINIPSMVLAAIRGGQLVTVKYFLTPTDMNCFDSATLIQNISIMNRRLFIQVCIEANQPKILALILNIGVKPTWDHFIYAVSEGNILIVKLLLQRRKDGTLLFRHLRPSRDRQLALLTALQNNRLHVVEFLLRYHLNGRLGFENVNPLGSPKVVELIQRNAKFASLFLRSEFKSLSYWPDLVRICSESIDNKCT